MNTEHGGGGTETCRTWQPWRGNGKPRDPRFCQMSLRETMPSLQVMDSHCAPSINETPCPGETGAYQGFSKEITRNPSGSDPGLKS